MELFGELWRRLLCLFRRGRLDRELEEEMQFHLEMKARQNREAGMDSDEALFAARRRFGNPALLREQSHEAWGWRWLDGLVRDVRYGLRSFGRSPAFTALAVLTLALGLGVKTAIFAVLYSVVLRPLPYPDAHRLVKVYLTVDGAGADL